MPYLLLLACSLTALAAEPDPVLSAAAKHAREIAGATETEVQVDVGPFDTSRLPPCSELESYSPPGIRKIGRTRVGIRCNKPLAWNILVPVRITRVGNYITAQQPIKQQETIQANDLAIKHGELPDNPVTQKSDAIGKSAITALRPGQAIRTDQLRLQRIIHQGQVVRVVVQGPGYQVKSEGKAINDGAIGESVRVRMASGKTIVGIGQADGSVLLEY